MKPKLLAFLAGSLLTTCAFAQSSVTLYGSIDEGVTYNSNAHGSTAVLAGPVAAPDFFGFRGTEDLGGGLKAIFALENGFLSNTGAATVAGQAFSHFAYVGLASTRYGTVTMGRQLDLATDSLRFNSNGFLQYSFYFFHPANLDNLGVTADSVNNSVKYTTPDFGGLTFSGMYGFADGSTQLGRVVSADAIYNHGPLRAAASYSSWNNHTLNLGTSLGYTSFLGQSLANGALFSAQHQDISGISARYQLTPKWAVHGMFTQVNIAAALGSARMRNAEAGADYHITLQNAITLSGYVSWFADTRYSELGIGDIFSLSKRTIVYAQAVYQHANGRNDAAIALLTPSGGANQTAIRIGLHHFF